MRFTLSAFVVVLCLGMFGAVQAQVGPTKLVPVPLAERATVRPGSTVHLALRVPLPPDIHIQSNSPRDRNNIPTTITFDAVPGVKVIELVFPKSVDIELPGYSSPLDVLEGTVVIGIAAELARDLAPGPLTLPAIFRYQACNNSMCFQPVKMPVSWALTVAPGSPRGTPEHADVFKGIAWGTGAPPSAPKPATPVVVAALPGDASPAAILKQFDEFEIRGNSAGGYMGSSEFLKFIDNAEKGIKSEGAFVNRGPLAILALVFFGGLALNLTPCVLPMIPINLMIIGAGAQSGRRGRGFFLGSMYGAAMAAVYGVLGLIVILTAGTFGTINASPWFNIGIAALFVVLGLAMFDVVAIDFSRYSSRIKFSQESRGSAMLAFGMGAVAALLAGACVAPVVIQVVVFASDMHAQGSTAALALPFVLGLGMALPWPIAGAGFSALPKPGAWMVRVKQVMGVFILASAVYYGYVAYEILSQRWVDPASVRASVNEMLESGWQPSLSEGLAAAKRENRLALIDFWATWCKNCLTMDQTTLASPEVKAALADYVKIKFQAEDLDTSPAKELMRRVGGRGLPTYVIVKPR